MVRHACAVLEGRGFERVLTGALSERERRGFVDAGFEPHEQLHLLSHDLRRIPDQPPATLRRPWPGDRNTALAVDAAAFPAFWRLDKDGLREAIGATPIARFRLCSGPTGVVGYAVPGELAGAAIAAARGASRPQRPRARRRSRRRRAPLVAATPRRPGVGEHAGRQRSRARAVRAPRVRAPAGRAPGARPPAVIRRVLHPALGAARALAIASLLVLLLAPAAGAQRASVDLGLASQTAFVRGTGVFTMRLDVDRVRRPQQLEMVVTVHRAVTSRSQFARTIDGDLLGTSIHRDRIPFDQLRFDAAGAVPVKIDLPALRPGVYPVSVRLIDTDDGSVVASLVTHLIRVPDEPVEMPLSVAWVQRYGVDPSLRPDGTTAIDSTGLDELRTIAGQLDSGVPLTIVPTPETIAALATLRRGHDHERARRPARHPPGGGGALRRRRCERHRRCRARRRPGAPAGGRWRHPRGRARDRRRHEQLVARRIGDPRRTRGAGWPRRAAGRARRGRAHRAPLDGDIGTDPGPAVLGAGRRRRPARRRGRRPRPGLPSQSRATCSPPTTCSPISPCSLRLARKPARRRHPPARRLAPVRRASLHGVRRARRRTAAEAHHPRLAVRHGRPARRCRRRSEWHASSSRPERHRSGSQPAKTEPAPRSPATSPSPAQRTPISRCSTGWCSCRRRATWGPPHAAPTLPPSSPASPRRRRTSASSGDRTYRVSCARGPSRSRS